MGRIKDILKRKVKVPAKSQFRAPSDRAVHTVMLGRVRKSNSLSPAYDPICLFYDISS